MGLSHQVWSHGGPTFKKKRTLNGHFSRPAQTDPYGLCRLIWCPVGRLVGGCGARAVSRKTPINFIQIDKIGPADYADDAANSLPRTLSLKSEHFFSRCSTYV